MAANLSLRLLAPGLYLLPSLVLCVACTPETSSPNFGTPGPGGLPTFSPTEGGGNQTPTPTATSTATVTQTGSSTSTDGTSTPTETGSATESPTMAGSGGQGTVLIADGDLPGALTVISPIGYVEVNALGVTSGATILYAFTAPTLGSGDLDRLTITADIADGELRVEPLIPTDLEASVTDLAIAINIPPSQTYTLETEGETALLGLTSGGVVRNGSGSVLGVGLDGSLDIQSADGGVNIQTDLSGAEQVTIASDAGAITLQIPQEVGASVNAETGDGAVSFSNITFNGTNFDGLAVGTVGVGSAVINLTTGSGNITVLGE